MQRFVFTIIFIILGLGQPNAYSQEKPNPPVPPIASSPSENIMDTQTTKDKKDSQKRESKKISAPLADKNKMSRHKVSILSASDKIAQEANWWAMWQTLIGGVGLALVFAATIYARRAWLAGKDGADVGRDTFNEAKETSYRQLRAYVGVGAGNYAFNRNNNGSAGFGATVQIKNYGQTPAYNVQASIRFEVVDYPGTDKIATGTLDRAPYTLHQGNIPSLNIGSLLTQSQVSNIVNQSARLFVIVFIKYTDYAGIEHSEKVQFDLPSIGNGNRFMASHSGTSATLQYYKTESSDDKAFS